MSEEEASAAPLNSKTPEYQTATPQLVLTAMQNLNEAKGCTTKEIVNYIGNEYAMDKAKIKRAVMKTLKRGVDHGSIESAEKASPAVVVRRGQCKPKCIMRAPKRRCKLRRKRSVKRSCSRKRRRSRKRSCSRKCRRSRKRSCSRKRRRSRKRSCSRKRRRSRKRSCSRKRRRSRKRSCSRSRRRRHHSRRRSKSRSRSRRRRRRSSIVRC